MSGGVELCGVAQGLLLGGSDIGVMDSGGGAAEGQPETTHPDIPCLSRKHRRVRKHQSSSHNWRKGGGGGGGPVGKRIRRNTQPAPNNTNEFLMQEHDHLFHLDLNKEEWGEEEHGGSHNHSHHHHPLVYSSSDEDQDYLSRDFSATYDVVNAERLNLMSKSELISEYQLLEERIESLERKMKSFLRARRVDDAEATVDTSQKSDPSQQNDASSDLTLVQQEVARLKDENRRIRADNRFLKKLMYGGDNCPPNNLVDSPTTVRADSTDSSGGGSGSSSDVGIY